MRGSGLRLSLAATLLLLGVGVCGQESTTTYTLDEVEAQVQSFAEEEGATKSKKCRAVARCELACKFLAFEYPSALSLPDSETYETLGYQYWSLQQESNSPACRFSPTSAQQVSHGLLVAEVTQCQFAVKSGGHAAYSGSSNIDNGITFDLGSLKDLSVSKDRKETSVQTGNVWHDVYTQLDPMGLAVIGGRVSAIGTGGLTLGGGLSFFSNRYGWACDNVNNYEVVFADGSIHDVSYRSKYSDLYWALRGGGNNFGIVTRVDLNTFAQGNLWGGSRSFLYTEETASELQSAFYNLGLTSHEDPYGQVILAFSYSPVQEIYVISAELQYGKEEEYPDILSNFTSVPGAIQDTLRITNLSGLTVELNNSNPGGYRESYWTYTVQNNLALLDDLVAIYQDEAKSINGLQDCSASLVLQLVTPDVLTQMAKNGGNALGLSGKTTLNLVNIAIRWSDEADDDAVLSAAKSMVDRAVAAAAAKGLDEPFLYQNYAAASQHVFPSYGKANYAKLQSISQKYDPRQVFQKLQPGYFKL